jgi:hypothetical protein
MPDVHIPKLDEHDEEERKGQGRALGETHDAK